MKIDAEIKFLTDCKNFKAGEIITIPVDADYINDCDDIIQNIEEEMWTTKGVNVHNEIEFTILNYSDLCAEFFEGD